MSKHRHHDHHAAIRKDNSLPSYTVLIFWIGVGLFSFVGLPPFLAYILYDDTAFFQLNAFCALILLIYPIMALVARTLRFSFRSTPPPQIRHHKPTKTPTIEPIDPHATYKLTDDGEIIEVEDKDASRGHLIKLDDKPEKKSR